MMRELEILSVAAVLQDASDSSLRRGQVGAVVERLAPDVYEVEFSDDEGGSPSLQNSLGRNLNSVAG